MTSPGLYLLDGDASLPVTLDAEGVIRWATSDALAGTPVSIRPSVHRLAPCRVVAERLVCCEVGVCANPAPNPGGPLTEAERETLAGLLRWHVVEDMETLCATVERILADRFAQVPA